MEENILVSIMTRFGLSAISLHTFKPVFKKKSQKPWNVFTGYLKDYYIVIRIRDESERQSLNQHYKWFLQSERLFSFFICPTKTSLHKEVQQRNQRWNRIDSLTPVCFKKALGKGLVIYKLSPHEGLLVTDTTHCEDDSEVIKANQFQKEKSIS